ncbi:uncharacterized protein LOC132847773 [Tachysurus vachellii]|uniref:uncharacterized protein LOC132847773 n=1 Tax=Tachysurus vachellii TaxID=175792 RepID=UPI00296AEB3E|nr:uncharacterized protein LOC132847773 [Tachysurus vachellii]
MLYFIRSGSVLVQTTMFFNTSSPVPSESLVLSVIQTLLSARLTNLTDSVKVLNFTYEKISDTCYAVKLRFNVSNISMSQNPDIRNDTYNTVISIINNASAVVQTTMVFNSSSPVPSESLVLSVIQTLLSARLTNLTDSVKVLNFTYEKISDTCYAVKFRFNVSNISMSQNPDIRNDTYNTVISIINNASAVVQTTMVFNSSSPVPSESLVLSVIQTLLSARLTNLTDSVKVLNFTYEKISDTCYAVKFRFNVSNISMSQNPDIRNDTYNTVISIINNASNTLLNEPGAEPFSAVVQTTMVFNSSSPVPSESLVLSVIQTLLSARLTNLTDSVKVLNFTYEKISDTCYAVKFRFNVSNISMSQNPDIRNDTYNTVISIINNASNTLLNEPGAEPFSAVVQTTMVFNSSSPVPSESLVLSVIQTLLSARLTNLTDSVKVLNFTYEKISDTCYAVKFRFNVSNISMSQNPDIRNDTYNTVISIINNASNTLLNEPGAEPFSAVVQTTMVFNSSSPVPSESLVLSVIQTLLSARLTNLTDSVKVLNFTYEKISDTCYAVKFRFNVSNISMSQNPDIRNDTYNTVISIINNASNTLLNEPGAEPFSAVVQTTMVFNSSSPVPSESLVLSVIQTLLSARLTNLTDSVKVLNFTYEKISDTCYAVKFRFNVSNISMSQNPDIRNDTYNTVISIINNASNTLLNEPGAEPFVPHSSLCTSSGNQVNGDMTYHFQDGDTKTPASFLNELKSAVVQTTMVFNSSSPVPSESLVLSVIQTLLSARLTNLTDSVKVLNFTYEKISDTCYAVKFRFNVSNISMSQNPDIRNDTYNTVISIINNASNTLLNEPAAKPFEPQSSLFTSSGNQVNSDMTYHFQDGDTKIPASFLNELKAQSTPMLGNVLIYIRLVFKNLSRVPSEADVLSAANAFLASNVRTVRHILEPKLNDPVSIQNITYQKIDNNSYIISFAFEITNVTIYQDIQLRNETNNLIQNTINSLLNNILSDKNATPFVFPQANYTYNGTEIEANSVYVFVEGDTKWTPSGFLDAVLNISGLSTLTTPAAQTDPPVHVVLRPTVQAQNTTTGGNSAWILGIIIPCSIVIILIPCWILLCCLLCGCCAGLRRRYNRRQSYNTHNTIHNEYTSITSHHYRRLCRLPIQQLLATELSAQAQQIAGQYQHLTRLTSLTRELIAVLHMLQSISAAPNPMLPLSSPTTAYAISSAANPWLAFPDKFNGDPEKCKGFLMQCVLFVTQQPSLYPSRIALVCSLLTGRALEWATAVWKEDGTAFPSFSHFLIQMHSMFKHPAGGESAEERLLNISQGDHTAADYALTFRTLAAQASWEERPLNLPYRKGLNRELQTELACHDEGRDLSAFIELSIQIDNLKRAHRTPTRRPPTENTEPMPLGSAHLTSEEKARRFRRQLCLYCGEPGHLLATCPTRPPNKRNTLPSKTCLQINSAVTTPVGPGLPAGYHDLAEAFSKVKATELPPHRPGDCCIELLPNTTPPKARIFPLSQPESKAINKYIEEELKKGFIRHSVSPASLGFFFVKKKDGGLRPCIDYRALNDITVKFRYPLPLVPSALEQLCKAKYFTKLDLCHKTSTSSLGYVISTEGVAMDDSKIQAVVNWPQPQTIKELQRFLGLRTFTAASSVGSAL